MDEVEPSKMEEEAAGREGEYLILVGRALGYRTGRYYVTDAGVEYIWHTPC